jgi:hypothetical protein
MAPPKVGSLGATIRKQSIVPPVVPVLEETLRASTWNENFHRDYIPPQKDTTPQVKVPTNGKYPLATLEIPPSVSIEGDMLGNIVSMKFVDHHIKYE